MQLDLIDPREARGAVRLASEQLLEQEAPVEREPEPSGDWWEKRSGGSGQRSLKLGFLLDSTSARQFVLRRLF